MSLFYICHLWEKKSEMEGVGVIKREMYLCD